MNRLIHYSDTELQALYSIPAERQSSISCYDKPKGLWVSVEGEDDWKSWCEAENFGCGALAYEIKLSKDANILYLSTASEIIAFTDEYSIEGNSRWDRKINWSMVASKYHGIIIAPYCWSCRLTEHTIWYYGWDCSSGCIWNIDAIAGFDFIPPD